jgi:surface antigen
MERSMNVIKTTVAAAATLALAACAGSGYGNKQVAGGLLGAAGGAVLGSQVGSGNGRLAATAIGTLLGAVAGSSIGQGLDRTDRAYAADAQQAALEQAPVGQTITWNNPDSGHSGEVTPTRTWQAGPDRYCREYQQTVIVGGMPQSGYGTACRQPDGSWQVVN